MHRITPPETPGALIGITKSGRPIRLIAGGSEPAPEPPAPSPEPAAPPQPAAPAAAAEPSAPSPAPPATPPEGTAPGTPEPPAPAEPQAGSVDQLPQWAQKLIRDGRTEAAANRTKAKEHADALAALQSKTQEQLDGIARALGLKPEEATPEQIMAERDAERARAETNAAAKRASDVELAVFRAAARAGADGDKLLDSRTFVAGLKDLDPAGEGFAQQVSDRIAAALDQNPSWKLPAPAAPVQPAPPLEPAAPPQPAPQVPASSPQPGSYGQPPAGPRQLTAEDAKNMSAQQVLEAVNKGLFVESGFGPARATQR